MRIRRGRAACALAAAVVSLVPGIVGAHAQGERAQSARSAFVCAYGEGVRGSDAHVPPALTGRL